MMKAQAANSPQESKAGWDGDPAWADRLHRSLIRHYQRFFDVALEPRRGDPGAVLSLDDRVYASDFAARDSSLGRGGDRLVQASAGLRAGETAEEAWSRIEGVLDRAYRGWRERVVWRRRALAEGGAGPADPPGMSWRDRPAIDRGQDRWLAGDCVAAPGILSEVAFESGRRAAALCLEKSIEKDFGAPGSG